MTSHRMRYKIGLTEYNVAIKDIDASGNGSGIPVGTIIPYVSSASAPTGFLLCDGSSVSRTMYPDLFDVIGTSFGSGDGSTTFNLPDLIFVDGDSAKVYGTDAAMVLENNHTGQTLSSPVSNMSWSTNNNVNWVYAQASGQMNIVRKGGNAETTVYADMSSAASSTIFYFIKAFDDATSDSALVDMTECANELNKKMDLNEDWCYIYPNGGSEGSPATVISNTRYVEANPFTGYIVRGVVEFLYNSKWMAASWQDYYTGNYWSTGGTVIQASDGSLIVIMGSMALASAGMGNANIEGIEELPSADMYSAPCRVKVWKVGKIPQNP